MIVRTIITAILAIYAMYLTMRHNLHMLQLNGYKNDEHIVWLKRNLRQQWLLGFGIILGIIRIFFPFLFLDILIYITLVLDILVYRAIRRLNSKKKLVYTARVKRMIITTAIIVIAVFVVAFYFGSIEILSGVIILVVSSQWLLVVVANVINHPIESCISLYYVNDAKKILRNATDTGLKVIGITGSYGKTSMKFYLKTMLENKYNVLITPGNYNTPLGVTITVRNDLNSSHEIFLCEMGARRVGEIKEICDIAHPDYGIITSVGPQHLDTFINIENIKNTKFELADSIDDNGIIFLNGDNSYIQEKAGDYPNKVFYFSQGEGKGYKAKDIEVSQIGTDFTVVTPDGEEDTFHMRLIGEHNVINVVGAIAVANTLGMSLSELKIPVRKLQPAEHRLQLRKHGLVTIIDDAYNSNPVGSKAAVETLAMFDGLHILVTPGMVELGEKEEEFNYKFGTYAANCCDYILLVGKKRGEVIEKGAISEGFPPEKCLVFDRLEDALSYAYSIKSQEHKYILLENDLPDNY